MVHGLSVDGAVKQLLEAVDVGVVAFHPSVGNLHHVDGADLLGGLVKFVEQGDDGFLIRYGDVETAEVGVAFRYLLQLVQRLEVEVLIEAVETFVFEFLVEVEARLRVLQRVSYESVTFHAPIPNQAPNPRIHNKPMMRLAMMMPPMTARTLFLKSISRKLAARVPVQAPVPGNGIPTKSMRAT